MFDSRSVIIKIGGYFIIGFFTLIIIISFGMPDFITKSSLDDNVAAVINGEKIYKIDYLRFKDSMARYLRDVNDKETQKMILDNLITRRLLLQKANEIGIKVSEARIKQSIKDIPIFKDKAGKFDRELLERYLTYNHQGLKDFYSMIKEDLIINEVKQMISNGISVSPEDIITENAINNSKIRIKYCFISTKDLKDKLKNIISISEAEIDEELKMSKNEIKDPKTDRDRIKKKLENDKYNKQKIEIVRSIDQMAASEKSFDTAASYLGGKIFTSDELKIGDPVRKAGKGQFLHSISNSIIFKESCLSLDKNRTSKVIDSFDGLYIFTTITKVFELKNPSPEEHKKIADTLAQDKENALFIAMMSELRDKSTIIRNLKFN